MKRIIIIAFLGISLMISLNACYYDHGSIRGYGNSISIDVDIESVTGIELDGSLDVEIVPSDTFRVVIVAQENIAKLIMIEPFGNIAKVNYKPRINVIPTDVAKVVFYMPELCSIKIDGSGDIYVFDEFESDNTLNVSINGSGDIIIENIICNKIETTINGSGNMNAGIVANNTETTIRGSGDIEYYGTSSIHTIRISGSGDIDSFDLYTEETYIDISGSGNSLVWVETLLDVYISGSGNVTYKGNPDLYIDIPGSGDVNNWK